MTSRYTHLEWEQFKALSAAFLNEINETLKHVSLQ